MLSILSNGSACLPMRDETVIFTKPPLLQISCCWQKFMVCFQALIYDLCIYFLHSDQHSTEVLLIVNHYLSRQLDWKNKSTLVFSDFCYLAVIFTQKKVSITWFLFLSTPILFIASIGFIHRKEALFLYLDLSQQSCWMTDESINKTKCGDEVKRSTFLLSHLLSC